MTGVQVNIPQRLTQVQQDVFSQAFEAAGEQLQLVGQVRDRYEFASAQSDLAKRFTRGRRLQGQCQPKTPQRLRLH
jgi:hypothetical protein